MRFGRLDIHRKEQFDGNGCKRLLCLGNRKFGLGELTYEAGHVVAIDGKPLKRYQRKMLARARTTETERWLLETQNIIRRNKFRPLARLCNRFRSTRWIAQFIWEMQGACLGCGALVGMNSVVFRPSGWKQGGMFCWPCHDKMTSLAERRRVPGNDLIW